MFERTHFGAASCTERRQACRQPRQTLREQVCLGRLNLLEIVIETRLAVSDLGADNSRDNVRHFGPRVCPHAREAGPEAKAGIRKWMTFHNHHRPHAAPGGRPPAVVHWLRKDETQPDQQVQRAA